MAAAGVAAALSVRVPCGGGQNRGAAGVSADASRHRDRALGAARGRDRVRRDAEIAALDHGPAADRRPDHADPRQVGRPRPPGRAADADRSAPAAGGRIQPGGRARGARGGGSVRAPAGRSAPASCSPPAPSASRSWSRPKPRCAPPKRTCARSARRCSSSRCSCVTTPSPRRPPASSATCRCASATRCRRRRC